MGDHPRPGDAGAGPESRGVAERSSTQPPWLVDLAVASATSLVAAALIGLAPSRPDLGAADLVLGGVAVVLTGLRRHHTAIVLALSTALAVATTTWLERPTLLVFSSLVLLYTLCVERDRRTSILVGAAVAAVLYVSTRLATEFPGGDERLVIVVVWTIAAVGIADASRSRRDLIRSSNDRLRAVVAAGASITRQRVAEERLAIARDLHDLLAHNLSVMNVQTGVAAHLLHTDPARAERALDIARAAGRDILDELRDLLGVLRSDEDHASTESLPDFDDLAHLVDGMRRSGSSLRWSEMGTRRPMSVPVSVVAYRVAQEALTNAAKHGSGTIELITRFAPDRLHIDVTNPVARPVPSGPAPGLGIVGIRERVSAVGGHVDIADDLADRFVVRVTLPLVPPAPGGGTG